MNTTETANQLRLAAELIETGHPWQRYSHGARNWINSEVPIAMAIAHGDKIRPILATPPDGRPLHNPDDLTAEQVGAGWRLFLPEEVDCRHDGKCELWCDDEWLSEEIEGSEHGYTYRLPLSVPWPEAKLDPYAELKAAHAAGKAIEVQMPNGEWFDYNPDKPQWNLQPECYRIKPEPPPFQLPPPPISWRYAETTKQVELGPEDVPPGSILKANSWASHEWRSVSHVYSDGVLLSNCPATAQWSHLMLEYRINRSIPLTGKWDANAWEPCSKEVQA